MLLNIDLSGPETKRRREYWEALGRFIHRFASVERQITHLLTLESALSDAAASVIFDNTRLGAAISTIKRLRKAAEKPDSPSLTRAFDQITIISETRNAIVHLGAIVQYDKFEVHPKNKPGARSATIRSVSPEVMNAMTADLNIISHLIYLEQCAVIGQKLTFSEGAAIDASWHYVETPANGTGKAR